MYHCGYHSEASYGAASYLITREGGNVLMDSPRFDPKLLRRIQVHSSFAPECGPCAHMGRRLGRPHSDEQFCCEIHRLSWLVHRQQWQSKCEMVLLPVSKLRVSKVIS